MMVRYGQYSLVKTQEFLQRKTTGTIKHTFEKENKKNEVTSEQFFRGKNTQFVSSL